MKVMNNQIEWLDKENGTENLFAVCYITQKPLIISFGRKIM